MDIHVSKRFLKTMGLSLIWIIAAFFWASNAYSFGYRSLFENLLLTLVIFLIPMVLTYVSIHAGKQSDEKEKSSRSKRVQHWLESLDDDELDALRDRLQADVPERTLEALMTKPKRR